MQIHEITQRKQVTEILGALSAVAGGIAKAGANQFVQSQTGQSMTTDKVSGGPNARMGAYKVNAAAVAPLAKQLQLAWAQTVQEFLKRTKDTAGNPATNLAAVSPGSVATLEPQLTTMINNAISPRGAGNYKDLVSNAGQDPVAQQAAKEVVAAIDKGVAGVMSATMKPGDNSRQLTTSWLELSRDGIAPAQQIIAFDSGNTPGAGKSTTSQKISIIQTSPGVWEINGEPLQTALKNPVYAQAWKNLQATKP